jgi:asparagine synthase (glutamine-hydrolysing)
MIEVYRHAVENNLRVVLSGNDGDTVVSHGRAYYNELLWSGRWIELWQDLRERVNALGGSNNDVKRALIGWVKYYLRNSPLTKPLVNAFQTVTRNGSTRAEDEDGIKARQEGGAWRRGWRPYFDEQFIRSVKPHSEAHPSGRQWTTERKHHHMLLTRPLMESAFRKFDALANGLGMEIRFPFHDVRLVEFCLSLPGHLKRRGKWTRWIEHAAMEDIVPPEIQARHDKTDARWVYTNGLTEYESDTLSSFSKILSEGSSPVSRYVDCNRASDLALKMANGNLSQRDQESERILLWRILSLHKWMEMYYDEKNPQSVDYEAV